MDEFADQVVSNFLGSEVCIKLAASKNQKGYKIICRTTRSPTLTARRRSTRCFKDHDFFDHHDGVDHQNHDDADHHRIILKICLQTMAKVKAAMQQFENDRGSWRSCGYDFDCMMRILATLCQCKVAS